MKFTVAVLLAAGLLAAVFLIGGLLGIHLLAAAVLAVCWFKWR